MTYFEGFVVPVPEANEGAYRKHSADFAPVLQGAGVKRMVETWESDVPEGKLTDFRKAVDARPAEKIVFSWFEYPDRQARDAANAKMMSDPRMAEMGKDMPFDGKRMIMGGFDAIVDEGSAGGGYTDGWVVPVPSSKRDAYRELASKNAELLPRIWGDTDRRGVGRRRQQGRSHRLLPRGQSRRRRERRVRFDRMAGQADPRFGLGKIMKDERMQPQGEMPFNGQRMFWGGFEKILDTAQQQPAPQASAPVNA